MRANDFGVIEYRRKTLTITQLPYIDSGTGIIGREDRVYYNATAEDDEGNDYMITWTCIDEGCEDESDACDWEVFTVKEV